MNVRPEVAEVVRRFLARGDGHLSAAEVLVGANGQNVADAACYHCEEAVDKYLKALLTLKEINAPRTHDLNYIHNLLPEACRLPVSSSDLLYLSTYGIERWWDPDQGEAVRALAIARSVRQHLSAIAARWLPDRQELPCS